MKTTSEMQFSKVGSFLKNDLAKTAEHIKTGKLGQNLGAAAVAPVAMAGKAAGKVVEGVGRAGGNVVGSVVGGTMNGLARGFMKSLTKGVRKEDHPGVPDWATEDNWEFSEYAKMKQFDSTEDKLENLERRKKNLEENNGNPKTIQKVENKIKKLESKQDKPVVSGADDEDPNKEEFGFRDKVAGAIGKQVVKSVGKKLSNVGKDVAYAARKLPTNEGIQGIFQGINAGLNAQNAKAQLEEGNYEGAMNSIQNTIGSAASAINTFRRPKRTFWDKLTGRNKWKRDFSGISDKLAEEVKSQAVIGMKKKFEKMHMKDAIKNKEDKNMKKIIRQFSEFCEEHEVEFSEENLQTFSDMKIAFKRFCDATGTKFTSSNFEAFCDCGVCPVCQEEREIDKNEEVPPPNSDGEVKDDDENDAFFSDVETELPKANQGITAEDKAKANEDNKVEVDDGTKEMDHDALKLFSDFCKTTGIKMTAENFKSFSEAFDESDLPPENPEKPEEVMPKEDKKKADDDSKSTVDNGEDEVKDHEALKQEFAQFCEDTGIENNEENFKLFSDEVVESELPKDDQGITAEDKAKAAEDNKVEVDNGAAEMDHEALKAFSDFCDATGVEYSDENFKLFSQKNA